MNRLYIAGCQCGECEAHRRVKLGFEAAERELARRREIEARPKAPVIDIYHAFALRAARRKL